MAALVVGLVSAVSSLSAEAGAHPRARWTIDDEDGPVVQYRVPETDDRAIRLMCGDGGRILVAGPAATDGPDGAPISVTLRGVAGSKTYTGDVGEGGEGFEFVVLVDPADDPIATLLAGRKLIVRQGADSWTIPGRGVVKVLRPMLAECARRSSRPPPGH